MARDFPRQLASVRWCVTPVAMNAPLTRAAEGLDRWAFTVAEVERMVEAGIIPPDTRLEVIGGEIVPMSAKGAARSNQGRAELPLGQAMSGRLSRCAGNRAAA